MYLIHLLQQLWHKGYLFNQVCAELLEELQMIKASKVRKDGVPPLSETLINMTEHQELVILNQHVLRYTISSSKPA